MGEDKETGRTIDQDLCESVTENTPKLDRKVPIGNGIHIVQRRYNEHGR